MALFQKKYQTTSDAPLYTLGLHKTILIVGLGNPGKEYDATRHNVGFMCVDAFARNHDFPGWVEKKDLKGFTTSHALNDTRIMLLKPQTFMNNSGEAVHATQHFYKIPTENVWVVYDDLDIPFGQIRTRIGGGSAGHNGVKSLIQHCGDSFGRIRIGVRNEIAEHANGADFVLGKFNKEETEQHNAMNREVTAVLTESIFGSGLTAETRSFIH